MISGMETVGLCKIVLRNVLVYFCQVVYFKYIFMYIVNQRHLAFYMFLFLTAKSFLKYFFFPSADGVCVFKCLVNRDTEYCRVGKQSLLITVGYNSALIQFKSQSGKYILNL